MATLKHIRKRIKSVKNTQKITKAMKMVAAAKLRRAQQAIVAARPYAAELSQLLVEVMGSGDLAAVSAHPLLSARPNAKKVAVVVFTSDRGLCGAFNTNVIKKTISIADREKAAGRHVEMTVFGRKGRDGLTSRGYPPSRVETEMAKWTLAKVRAELAPLVSRYEAGELDQIILVYNRFVSAISQDPTERVLLPFAPSTPLGEQSNTVPERSRGAENQVEYEYEPDRATFAQSVVEKMLLSTFQLAHLESQASELGARMSAMDSATNNASDMIRRLTLVYNRARQAAITLELMDIVNGSESIA